MKELKEYKSVGGAVVILNNSLQACAEKGFTPGEVIHGKGNSKILVGVGGRKGTVNKDIWFRCEGSQAVCCLPGADIVRLKKL